MEIKKGSRWVCIKDVSMYGGDDEIAYIKGNVYKSEQDGCITDRLGDVGHLWVGIEAEKYFIPYSKLDRVYTKYTEKLEKLFDAYEGKKKRTNGGSMIFFDNCQTDFRTGYFYASDAFEVYYIENNFTYLSEQAFIEFMGLSDTTDTKSPQPHYDNSKGSLFQLAEQLQLNHWEFDILKRLVRCRKKGQFKEDLQKIKDTCDIYIKESPH